MRENYINCFIETAIQSGGWMLLDKVYLKNRLISLIGDVSDQKTDQVQSLEVTTEDLLEELLIIAEENSRIDRNDSLAVEKLSSEIMELLTPPTSVVNALFSKHYDNSPQEATDYYHLLNINNGYVQMNLQQANLLEVDDSIFEIRQKKEAVSQGNECQQCFNSEGYGYQRNRIKRMIRMNLKGESWGFYFQPNPLVTEHAIFSTEEHKAFNCSRQSYESMLRLIDIFPHYFVSFDPLKNDKKDHGFYFGGHKKLPLIQAEDDFTFDIPGFVTVKASLVKWPLSVIRLKTTSKKNLLNSMEYLNLRWQQYSYPSLDIIANDKKGNPQHTILPVFYREGDDYVAELILGDTSSSFERTAEYEQLLFYPHGMIDLMGVVNIKDSLEMNDRFYQLIRNNMEKQSIFKKNPEGQKAFIRFVDTL